jgi:hypothetical protein
MKKVLTYGTLIVGVIVAFMIYWHYYNTFSEGNRSGLLQKFSRKGNIFKTYEGELVMSSIASTNSVTIASEKFHFSVKDKTLATKILTLEGKKVLVSYVEKRGHFPWDGETNYFVQSIELVDSK